VLLDKEADRTLLAFIPMLCYCCL